jgi:hypothetical protein
MVSTSSGGIGGTGSFGTTTGVGSGGLGGAGGGSGVGALGSGTTVGGGMGGAGGVGGHTNLTFQDMCTNIAHGSSGFNNLISAVCWIGGAGLGVTSVFKIKEHVDSGGRTPMKESMIRLGAAGALLAFPFIMSAMQGSISSGNITRLAAVQLQMDTTMVYK